MGANDVRVLHFPPGILGRRAVNGATSGEPAIGWPRDADSEQSADVDMAASVHLYPLGSGMACPASPMSDLVML